jgi:transcriptional regulator with XRE-family HTH domain
MSQETTIDGWMMLAGQIRGARQEMGLSQGELARRAQVARSWLARVEAGHHSVEFEPLLRLLTELDLELALRPRTAEVAALPSIDGPSSARRKAWGLAGSAAPADRRDV